MSVSRAQSSRHGTGVAPGALRAALPAEAAAGARTASAPSAAISTNSSCPPAYTLAGPAFSRLLPVEWVARGGGGRSVSTGLGQLGLNWQVEPRAHRTRRSLSGLVAADVRVSGRWSGVIQDTASTATFVCTRVRAERASNHSRHSRGNAGAGEPVRRVRVIAGAARWRRRRCSPDSAATTCA